MSQAAKPASQSPPPVVLELIERFERNRDSYKDPRYNETQLRREFLDPLFNALGWDMHNEQGYAEAYKDVIHEDAIKVGEATKAPDYCFRIGGARKFFLEAKKPAIDIKNDVAPAFQLRRYAWTTKLPLGILSDFEEFAVYDCRVKPHFSDKASVARILYIPFTEFAARWTEIAGIFSRDAVLKGSFDKYAESNKVKRGTADVDDEFLKTIEEWRSDLARNLALRNPKLTQRELNFAVQRIIDRIIFLRICEGRGLETYGRLQALGNADRIYPRLCQLFEEADARYNSGLFHFRPEKNRHEAPDELTLKLEIDDKLLRSIFKSIYYPESPYVFSALPAEILGQVYEQFLGKVIRLTEGHHAVVEEKPEVKKAGGVYYTPSYIVDYIVQNTVGKLITEISPGSSRGDEALIKNAPAGVVHSNPRRERGETSPSPPQEERAGERRLTDSKLSSTQILNRISKLRILDPACGSGSFLLGAYEHLLKWHLNFYLDNDPAKWLKGAKPALVQVSGGRYQLTIAERKRILLNNIYGVDIDAQAVETTKLSLLLKVLEGETQQTLQPVLRMFQERALPDLGDNIKCGNSLIGSDFYQQQSLNLLTEEEKYRINVFDWAGKDGFPEIMKAGGFDAVIGNPPYVRQESLAASKEYFSTHYEAFEGTADLYVYFMEKGVKLLRSGGLFSIIVSSSFLRTTYGEPLRRTLKKHAAVIRIVDFGGLAIFAKAKDTYVCIPLLRKEGNQTRVEVSKVQSLQNLELTDYVRKHHYTIPHQRLSNQAWSVKSDEETAVFQKIAKGCENFGDYVHGKFCRGVLTGFNEAFEIGEETRAMLVNSRASAEMIKPFVGGQNIRRYYIENERRYLIVVPAGWTREQMTKAKKASAAFTEREAWGWFSSQYETIAEHLVQFSDALKKRQDKGDYWWELRPCDYYGTFNNPKIIFPDICKAPRFFTDTTGMYLANTAYCIGTADPYLLGILNSRVFWFAISNISIPFGVRAGEYRYRLIYQYMEKVPIRVIDPANSEDTTRRDHVVSLVQQMLDLHKRLPAAKTPQEKTAIERQIAATDAQIDKLVYELYGLTEDEIRIVEGKEAALTAPEQTVAEEKEKPLDAFAAAPDSPGPGITPEQAYSDAAHYYSAKEEPPPYNTN